MCAATPNFSTETSPAGPTFSYAQAAKGRSPSMPSPSQLSNDHPEPAYVSERRTSVPEAKTTVVDSLRLAKEGIVSQACEDDSLKAMADSNSTSSRAPEAISKSIALSHQQSSVRLPQVTPSAPPSPGFGASSTSTLPKEDELSSTANGSSDSTWDKQSQGSQNGNKAIEKVEGDKEQSSVPAWNDESPHSVSLKEAPPPAINFWQHRKEIQEAKAKTKQSGHLQTLKQPSPGSGTAGFAAKNPDHNLEIKKQDNKKKSKASGMSSEDGSGSGAGKEGNRIIEGKTRGGEEGTPTHLILRCWCS